MLGKFLIVVFLQLKIPLGLSTPLKYFQQDSFFGLNILLLTEEISSGIGVNSHSGFKTPIALKKYGSFPTHVNLGKDQFLAHLTIFAPRNNSGAIWALKQVTGHLANSNYTTSSYFTIIWPNPLESESAATRLISSLSYDFNLDTNVFLLFSISAAGPDGSRVRTSLFELYSIKKIPFSKKSDTGAENQINFSKLIPKVFRRTNFQGIRIVAVASGTDYYQGESRFTNKTGTLEFESGFAVSLYKDMKIMLNFSEGAMKGFWMEIENGTLIGSQGLALNDGSADICIAQNVERTDLANFVTFLQPTYPLSVLAFFKEPPLGSAKNIYTGPLKGSAWAFFLTVSLMVPWIVKLTFKLLSRGSMKLSEGDKELGREPFIWSLGVICQQGWYLFPKCTPLKIVFLIFYLAAVVHYTSYSATLVSTFAVKESTIQTFQDLLNYKYNLIIDGASASMEQFSVALLNQYNTKAPTPVKTSLVAQAIMSGNSALIYYWDSIQDSFGHIATADQNVEKLICDTITAVPVDAGIKPTGMSVKKGSPYRETFNSKIIQLKERGFNYRYAQEYKRSTQPQCPKKSKIRHDPIQFMDVVSAHILLFTGFCVSLISLVVELIVIESKYAN